MNTKQYLDEITGQIIEPFIGAVSQTPAMFGTTPPKYLPMILADEPRVYIPLPTGLLGDLDKDAFLLGMASLPVVKNAEYVTELDSNFSGTEGIQNVFDSLADGSVILVMDLYSAWDLCTGSLPRPSSIETMAEREARKAKLRAS